MKTWEQQVTESAGILRAPRRKHRPNSGLSWGLVALALICLLFIWPLSIVLIIVAVCIDRVSYLCGACGNKVENTSTLCPTCRAHLS